MKDRFDRTKLLIGEGNFEKLKKSKVIVFGLGGVGSFAVEALARSGIENISIVDGDVVDITNINRQLIADSTTIGTSKTHAMKNRLYSINPDINVSEYNLFVTKENIDLFDFSHYDYVIDAIDTVTSKILIIEKAYKSDTPIISSMGTAGKINPTMLKVADIYSTSQCPLARVMRKELKNRFVKKLKVVYSEEPAIYKPKRTETGEKINASIAFVPSVAGLIIAGEVVKDIIK